MASAWYRAAPARAIARARGMGAAGVLAGFVLLTARWKPRWPRSVAWAWPALLLATSLVLLFYAE